MKIRSLLLRRLSVFPAMLFCVSSTAVIAALDADAPAVFAAPAASTIPPAVPVLSKYAAFSDRVAGRRLLFASRDAYRNAPSLRVSAQWNMTTPDGRTTSGTETILAQFGQGKLAITSETEENPKTVRRAIAAGAPLGGTLLVTRYQATTPNPTRQFSRYPLDETTPLTRSLQTARFDAVTKGAEFLLNPDLRFQNGALVYVSRPDSSSNATTILQTDIARTGDRVKITRRYVMDAKTNRLRRYEEWRSVQGQPRPATKKRPADDGMRVTYRREDYTEGTAPITPAAFSQALPAGYTEQAVAAAALPPVPNQPPADPKALALMRKWQAAQDRFLTLNVVADVRSDVQQRTENSRPNQNGRGRDPLLCTFWRIRPGQARITVNTIDPKTQQPRPKADYVAVADGQRVRINDYVNGRSDTNDQRDPAAVPLNRMRQVVGQAWDSGIAWVFDGPPAITDFSQVALDTSSAAPALVFSQTYKGATGRGQKSETRMLWRVTLGPDNLPREVISRRDSNLVGGYERDQPPTFTTRIRLQRVAVDAEPLPETFILPQEIVRR